jgi:histidine triad (HIT) family protein
MDCVFCKIATGEIPSKFLYQDKEVVAFADLHPQAPIHVLIVPKKPVRCGNAFTNPYDKSRPANRER